VFDFVGSPRVTRFDQQNSIPLQISGGQGGVFEGELVAEDEK
jgi:hypothetical protein